MKIDIAGEKSILVELSKEDLFEFNITYDELDYSNAQTKRVLFRIIEQIRNETGKSIDCGEKLQIDVMPDTSGGCLMIFTQCSSKELTVINQKLVLASKSIDDFIDCSRALKRSKESFPTSSLYETSNGFIMTVSSCSPRQRKIISEFLLMSSVDEAELERIDEYGKCLKKDNALEILCGKTL